MEAKVLPFRGKDTYTHKFQCPQCLIEVELEASVYTVYCTCKELAREYKRARVMIGHHYVEMQRLEEKQSNDH